MTKSEFCKRIVDMQDTLYRVSYGLTQNPMDQADAVQESIAKALVKRTTLRNDEYLQTWMIRILINVCRDMRKKRRWEFPAEEHMLIVPPTGNKVMIEAFSEIEEKYRLPLILHHIEGYKTREIATMLFIPEGTVKSRIRNGRNMLKSIVEKGGLICDGI